MDRFAQWFHLTGASTLTQQLIKNNVFEAGGESNIIAKIKRKIQEQYLAINAEKQSRKKRFLPTT